MGKVRVVEGTIQEVGLSSVEDGDEYMLSFIKLNGERIRDIGCEKFVRSFIKEGATVKLSIAKGWLSHEVSAVQLTDGEVIKGPFSRVMAVAIQMYFLFAFILACGSYGLIYKDLWIVYFAWVLGGAVLITRFFIGFRFKARHVLDGGRPPVLSES